VPSAAHLLNRPRRRTARRVGRAKLHLLDFKTFGWDRQDGIRIDHLLLSPQAADRPTSTGAPRIRGWDKPATCASRSEFFFDGSGHSQPDEIGRL